MVLLPAVLFWFGCAIATAIVASQKNRSTKSWFIAGLLMPVIALIAIAGVPPLMDWDAVERRQRRRRDLIGMLAIGTALLGLIWSANQLAGAMKDGSSWSTSTGGQPTAPAQSFVSKSERS